MEHGILPGFVPPQRWQGHGPGRTKGEDIKSSPMPPDPTSEDRQRGALLIAASLIAAIRLRGEPINQSPKVVATIADSITLARMVLQRINGSRQ
jgi:hypothetical protein